MITVIVYFDHDAQNPGYVARIEEEGGRTLDIILEESSSLAEALQEAATALPRWAEKRTFCCPLCYEDIEELHPDAKAWEAGDVVYHVACLAAEDRWGGVRIEEEELEDFRGWVR